jgi:anthranilate synthase component 1
MTGSFGDISPGIAGFAAGLALGKAQLVWTRVVADTETPVSAMLKLGTAQSGGFLLESVEGGQVRGRYSLLGLDPDLVWRATGDASEINRRWRHDRDAFAPVPGPALAALRALVAVRLVEPSVPANLPSPLALPDMVFVRPTLILVFDRLKDELYLVAPVFPAGDAGAAYHTAGDAGAAYHTAGDAGAGYQTAVDAGAAYHTAGNAGAAYHTAVERIEAAQARLAQPIPARAPPPPTLPDGAPVPQLSPARYAEMVARAKDYIFAGDIFQVVLAQRFSVEFPLPPFDLYRALRRINPSPFLYFLDLPGFAIVGSSPEILVRVRDGDVTIRPIAGTRPRGRDAVEDAENRASLLADAKEQAEHLMLLDLGRHDTGRVSLPGTVTVTDRAGVEFYSHVMHIVSNVRGRLDPRRDAVDALLAGFPAGTVSGAPKVRAMQVIAELEPEARGAYAGGVGYFSPDGAMDSCIVLRTAVVKDGIMHVQAGAGIVADSIAEYEQRECEAKAGALIAAAREALRAAAGPGFGQ